MGGVPSRRKITIGDKVNSLSLSPLSYPHLNFKTFEFTFGLVDF
jgi:hypothetical protein